MKRALDLASLSASLALAGGLMFSSVLDAEDQTSLRPAVEFESIADEDARSIALFEEAGKIILHPRCVNCHPAGDRPTQGLAMLPHEPPVFRGDADFGLVGMTCGTCHGPDNVSLSGHADDITSIPGRPKWHVAPIGMAWAGKSLGEICALIKDPTRNGGRSLDKLVDHMAHDEIVGWGWDPGAGREPLPGTQAVFGELIRHWAEAGAACPTG